MSARDLHEQAERALELVWQPLTIKNVTLRNRIVRSAHGTGFARGLVTDTLKAYQLERARGGVALGFGEGGQVHWSSPGFLDLTTDDVLDGLADMAAAVQAEGMKLFQQLMHGGPTLYAHDGSAPWAASAVPDPVLGLVPHPMTKNMIEEVVEGFAAAAGRVQQAGLDGVELHGGHSYLFSSFLSPATNRRTDEYGGSLENRSRILFEALRAVRDRVGPDFVVGVRLSPDGADNMTTADDIGQVVERLEAEGLVDYLNVSYGSHYRRSKLIGVTREPRCYMVKQVTGEITKRAALPTMVTGRILSLHDAEEILRNGEADMVSMVRALIADPHLVKKTREGRTAEVRPCISCNQACAGGLTSRGLMGCVVNPACGYEKDRGDHLLRISPRRRTVLVIGGGPAGLEAARSCALAGHRVVLHERADRLGGQLTLIEKSPSRSDVASLLPYYEAEMARLGVEVVLNSPLDSREAVDAVGADRVVVATGATPRRDGFQAWRPGESPAGLASIELLTGWDVLSGAEITGPVLLVDELGHYEAIDVAETLVRAGHQVHHVTRFSNLAANIPVAYDYAAAPHAEELYKGDYELYTRTLVHAVEPGRATVAPLAAPNRFQVLDVNTFVFMSGAVPDHALHAELEDIPDLYVIGDALGPRTLEPAITEGSLAAARFEANWQRATWVRYSGGSSV
ncbi:oxidoreductase [Streptomyces brasiliensis]|uniref:NADH:flavin oxidoreductase / NADH oxidase n=1 Tax=Streptomyces brasiliensis TaxID=1954 RepID=A0A917NY90_9ACTN|nr:FAD-dependent oxidoreductase [Streptomyces brasiliensis]GGJ41011.1 NADH:flavin oxidoreductase / NADH oxidase [Streptomyces brasiliensis]